MEQFDVIGDIHGCYEECKELIIKLGYSWNSGLPVHPEERKLVFLGDLTDRGPNSLAVIELVFELVKEKLAFYTPGNHCDKLYRFMKGNNVQVKHGLETTVEELKQLDFESERTIKSKFIDLFQQAPLYLQLDSGKLIVAHAGIKEDFIGKFGDKVKTFVRYGDITGKTNEDGTPVRRNWAASYNGNPFIVYGHTPVRNAHFLNRTCNIDTGAVFGGRLTAFRYPEMDLVSVDSSLPFIEEKFRKID